MNYNNFLIQIQLAYLALGILTATLIGSVAYSVWLFLNKGTAKFYVKDAMKYLKLIMACFVIPVFPFLAYPILMFTGCDKSFPMSKSMVNFLMFVLFVWILFVIAILLKRLINYFRICKLCKDNIPIEDEDVVKEVEYWKQRLGIRRSVGIYMNANLSSPAILYYWGYKVLLPAYEMTQQEMCMAILHELVHLKHRDIISKDMSFTVNTLHGFNPVTRSTKEHLVRWAEVLCDIKTCEMGKEHFDKQEYYHGILHLMENNKNEDKNEAMFCLSESKSLLKFRINMFAESGKEGQRRLKSVFYLMFVFMLLVTSIVFGITTTVTSAMFEDTLVEVEEQQNMVLEKETTVNDILVTEGSVSVDKTMLLDNQKDMEFTLEPNEMMSFPVNVSGTKNLHVFAFFKGKCAIGYIKKDDTIIYTIDENTGIVNIKKEMNADTVFIKNLTDTTQFVEVSYQILEY